MHPALTDTVFREMMMRAHAAGLNELSRVEPGESGGYRVLFGSESPPKTTGGDPLSRNNKIVEFGRRRTISRGAAI
jgi:hypothetical protein